MTEYGNERPGTDEAGTDPTVQMPAGPTVQMPAGPTVQMPAGPTVQMPAGPPATPPVRQLVRDPYAKLGGVSSGLAYHLGVDVSLIRLAFALTAIFSGVGLVVYLLAWLVLPKAERWPPVGARPIRRFSSRQAAVGLAASGILLILFVNGGGLAQTLVPILLIGIGVWMLRQPEAATAAVPAPATASAPSPNPIVPGPVDPAAVMTSPFTAADAPQPSDTTGEGPDRGTGMTESSFPGAAPVRTAPPPPPPTWTPSGHGVAPGAPVPPRRRRRWPRVLGVLVGLFLLFFLVLGALVVGLVVGTGFDLQPAFTATYRPDTVEEIPATIVHDSGEIVLDLTDLDPAAFDPAADSAAGSTLDSDSGSERAVSGESEIGVPVPVRIDLDFGEVRILVPEDLPVEVDAAVDLGEIDVFDDSADGIDPGLRVREDGSLVDLDIEVGFGQITVERVESTG